jgi:hypothetical protein
MKMRRQAGGKQADPGLKTAAIITCLLKLSRFCKGRAGFAPAQPCWR